MRRSMCELEGSYWLEMFERIGLLNIHPRTQVFVEPKLNLLLICVLILCYIRRRIMTES